MSYQHDYSYYTNIRITNPALFYSPETQREIVKSCEKQGDSFFREIWKTEKNNDKINIRISQA